MTPAQRTAVVAEARTWLRTPYHHRARLKQVGVDCAMLLAEVYERAGVTPHVEVGEYPPDWFMHRSEERFREWVLRCGGERVEVPEPGDVALYQFGRCFSHGAVVVEWPLIIHAFYSTKICELADGLQGLLMNKKTEFYTLPDRRVTL